MHRRPGDQYPDLRHLCDLRRLCFRQIVARFGSDQRTRRARRQRQKWCGQARGRHDTAQHPHRQWVREANPTAALTELPVTPASRTVHGVKTRTRPVRNLSSHGQKFRRPVQNCPQSQQELLDGPPHVPAIPTTSPRRAYHHATARPPETRFALPGQVHHCLPLPQDSRVRSEFRRPKAAFSLAGAQRLKHFVRRRSETRARQEGDGA